MQSTENDIVNKIKKASRGSLYFNEDFTQFGSGDAVKQALSRLEKIYRFGAYEFELATTIVFFAT